jgi:hypothetical protein
VSEAALRHFGLKGKLRYLLVEVSAELHPRHCGPTGRKQVGAEGFENLGSLVGAGPMPHTPLIQQKRADAQQLGFVAARGPQHPVSQQRGAYSST